MPTQCASLWPAVMPKRELAPQPSPATLTFSPVRPRVVYSIELQKYQLKQILIGKR
jgi:hypothetical protein